MSTAIDSPQSAEAARDLLASRLFGAAISAMEVATVYLGDRLGLYRALATDGPTTVVQLATQTGTDERYAREWLEQQACAGILGVENPAADAAHRRFFLPAGHAEVLLELDSLSCLTPLVRLVVGATRPLPAVLEAFRHSGGVPYADYGDDTREGIAAMNRPMFLNQLAAEWLPAMPDVERRLRADPPAAVADVGCGAGWSSIAIARAYPKAQVEGFDLDEPSIALARRNAAAEGMAGRVRFEVRDAADPQLAGRYDLVTAFETVHDMAQPVAALRAMRALVREGGAVLIGDERVGESFSAPGDDVERLNYGFSVLHCLPACLAESPSMGTGAVMRPPILRRYALEAGFRDVQILPVEHDFWHFYRLIV